MYVDILKALANYGPLTAAHIESNTKVSSSILQRYLDYFLAQGLIKEKRIGKDQTYVAFVITKTGLTLFKYFFEKTQIPASEELESFLALPAEVTQ